MDENSSLSSASIVDVDERVLVMPASQASGERISKILATREMVTDILATSNAVDDTSIGDSYELVILELVGDIEENIQLLRLINLNSRFCSVPQVVISNNCEELRAVSPPVINKRTTLLPSPVDPKQLLIKASAAIRDHRAGRDSAHKVSNVHAKNAELREITRRFKKDLEEAEKVQASILPTKLPAADGVKIAATYIPLDGVGGDMYDVWKLQDGRIGVFIGDVTGHGLPAALIGALTKMALTFSTQDQPHKALAGINGALCPLIPDERFVTAVMGFYDAKSGVLQVGRAGHPPAMLYRASTGTIEELLAKGPPLGFTDVGMFSPFEIVMEPGDKVLFYTDGLTECSNMEGRMINTDGLKVLFADLASQHRARELTGAILEYIDDYRQDRALKDDITLVVIERV